MIHKIENLKLAIIGLGYVGLPLAMEFAKKKKVIGFDNNLERVKELNNGIDKNLEFTKKQLLNSQKIFFTNDKKFLKLANCYIIAVPTPVKKNKNPDFAPLLNASKIVGKFIKKNDLIIYESTVYPGCTEEKCVPVLERFSKLKFNKDFFCGYSPERVNPGDKKHTISRVKKITSGSTHQVAKLVDKLYKEIILVGTHLAPSIRVAEAAKIIENIQRDVNIALINELSILFRKININTQDVLDAASTKWNFLNFKPGLVGGHCIGVDPYYLTFKAKEIGYLPKIILSGRNINDKMGNHIVSQLIKEMKKKKIKISKAKILIMGLTFKENCPDIRNSGIKAVIEKLVKFKCKLYLHDPYIKKNVIKKIYSNCSEGEFVKNMYDVVLIALRHKSYSRISFSKIKSICKKNYIIFDLKNLLNSKKVNFTL